MKFLCPDCGGPGVSIELALDLPPDDDDDETCVQTLACSLCAFRGAAIYRESRRGSMDGDAWHHDGYRLAAAEHAALSEQLRWCPTPRTRSCTCDVHRALAQPPHGLRGAWFRLQSA